MNSHDLHSSTRMDPRVESDPYVLFHGTSGESAESIASEGLRWRAHLVSRSDVDRVVEVFDAIDWCGEDQGGWLVLKAYTQGWDFARGPEKPVFLAESRYRALLYAQRDWAGGETARGILRAISDLERLAGDPDVYQRYEERLEVRASRTRPVERAWLRNRIAGLGDLAGRVRDVQRRFTHGAVVAVRFREEDLPSLTYHHMHGVAATAPIPPDRVAAIERVPQSYQHDPLAADAPLLWELPAWTGILERLRSRNTQ